jgi:hypothetical protein
VALITALLVPLALEVRGVAHGISSAGIQRVSPWSPTLLIPWKDVRSVTYEASMAWFAVDSRHGRVRISHFLDGMADFRRAFEEHVPRERWAAAFGAAPAASSRPAHAELGPAQMDDRKSRAAGLVCLVIGAGFTAWAWFEALHEGGYGVKRAAFGPQVMVVGIGLLIHGRGIPTAGVTSLTRAYGFAGGVAGLVNLYSLGYFEPPGKAHLFTLLTLLVWFLPGRMFGAFKQPRAPTRSPPPGSGSTRSSK